MYLEEFSKTLLELINYSSKMNALLEAVSADGDSAYAILMEASPEFQEGHNKINSLTADLKQILIAIKGFPLTMPDEKTKEFFEKASNILEKNFSEKDFYKFVELQFVTQSNEFSQRLKDVNRLYLQGYLHKRTSSLYNEAVNCYVYGFYNATCVLCRAISELIAKRYIDHRGEGNLLCCIDKEKKLYTIPGLLNKLSVSKEILQLYRNIHSSADKVLHVMDVKISQDEALKTIKKLQEFIGDFPKCI